MESLLADRFKLPIGTFLLTGTFILIEHFNGGVVSHHLLAREDLPAISNWWGLVTVPLLAWITASLVNRRNHLASQANEFPTEKDNKTETRFLLALLFGAAISLLWELRLESVLQYAILLPLLIAFFKPVHYAECLLGFVIGMIFTFGGILPIIIGLVLLVICLTINKLIHLLKTLFLSAG